MRRSPLTPLTRHTITRDLIKGLVVTIVVVFGAASTVNYFYSASHDREELHAKAEEIVDNLASVLASPVWNIDEEELQKILTIYCQSGPVKAIVVHDDHGNPLGGATAKRVPAGGAFTLTRTIKYDRSPIGEVLVTFSDYEIIARHGQFAALTFNIFALVTLALVLATWWLLRRYLRGPFSALVSGLDLIAGGDYTHKLPVMRQEDVNAIASKINAMASEIARRQDALEDNHHKLEILNQAIVDVFSSPDTNGLIRATLSLTHKVCGVSRGWFLSSYDLAIAKEEGRHGPEPAICVNGVVAAAKASDVAPYMTIDAKDRERFFSFQLNSRTKSVGRFTLAFDSVPNPAMVSMLKSIMALTGLAMGRQSFIRETAFIAAELQVAEAVQRALLPDQAKSAKNALVAYHYQPVLRVGGDWFSVIESRDGQSLYVILGDVTGHGLAQGLVTTAVAGALNIIESLIKDLDLPQVSAPSQIVSQLNVLVGRLTGKSNLRMTCVAARVDFARLEVSVCNAGHTFPILMRQDGQNLLQVQSLTKHQQHMLGEDSNEAVGHTYVDAVYPMLDEDILLLYTDGLVEAVDQHGKSFGRIFQRHFSRLKSSRSVEAAKDELISLFQAHTDAVPVKDDICLVVVGKRPDAAKTRVA